MECEDILLRLIRERDLPQLAAIQSYDYEHDPHAEKLPGQDVHEHRRRLLYEGYWRSLGSWSPSSWRLDFAVEYDGILVGVQSLEAEDFLNVRTVDTGSCWRLAFVVVVSASAMRTAVLSLAFEHLDALSAVSSARFDNGASIGVSRHLGYRDNGVSLNASSNGLVKLRHMRLTRAEWLASEPRQIRVSGVEPCLPWFGITPEQ